MIKKLSFIFIFVFVGIYVLYLNLGNILDATSKPKETQLLVCLGGGVYQNRVSKTKELFEKGYLTGDTIIFIGSNQIKGFDNINIYNPKGLKNTYEEVTFVKRYMKEQGLKSATFISESPHSKRILLFGSIFGDSDFEFSVVASDYDKWNKEYYYQNPDTKSYAFTELTKIFYNLFVYGILEPLGLKESFDDTFSDEVRQMKSLVRF